MKFGTWFDDSEIYGCLERHGYKIVTIRSVLKTLGGYKNSKAIKEDLHTRDSFLNMKLAYKTDKDLEKINERLCMVVDYLKERKAKNQFYFNDSYLIFMYFNGTEFVSSSNPLAPTLYEYKALRVFDQLLRETIKETFNLTIGVY